MDDSEHRAPDGGEPGGGADAEPDDVNRRLAAVERLLGPVLRPGNEAARAVGDRVRPAWQQVTDTESRVAVSVALGIAIAMLAALPDRVVNHPRWLIPSLGAVLLMIVVLVNPLRVDREARRLRPFSFALLALVSIANAASALRLIIDLVNGEGIREPETLLLTGGRDLGART